MPPYDLMHSGNAFKKYRAVNVGSSESNQSTMVKKLQCGPSKLSSKCANVWPQNWFTASPKACFVDIFGKGLYLTQFIRDTSLKIYVSLPMFPPSQTPLTPFVVPVCHFQNRTIFSWLINFDQQKFCTTYKYQKTSTLLKPRGMLVLSKTHNLSGEVTRPIFCSGGQGKQ